MIYLFDEKEKLVKIVNKKAVKTALQTYSLTTENYISDRLTVEMKALNDDEFEKIEYMAIQSMENNHQYHYFYIAQKKTVGDITTFTGVQSGIEELRKTPVFDKRPNNMRAEAVINDLLKNTNWRARFVAETINRSTNFYYISVFDALKKICKVWGLEMQFFVEMNGNGIGARYIDFKKRIGEATGKRVVYGHNALEILKEIERTNIYTALVGRGKGEQVSSAEESGKTADGYGRKITFENVVWSKAKGNPLDKPLGQRYLENPEMTRRYGIKNADGSMRAKIGFVDFNEEENPNELIKLTYQALVNASRPQLTLKTSSVYLKGVKIGDTIRVVRHDKKLDYDTRVFEITFNRLNNQSSDIKLGDQISESANSKIQSVADKAVEDFINNEFNSFVQNLPDFVKSADGYNTNWYSVEDPVKKYPKKVLINDIWYKPDPEHEGHTIMQRWTGEAWDEIVRSYDKESLTKRISEEIANFDKTFQSVNEQNKRRIDEILQSSGASSLLAQGAKRIGLESVAKLEEFKRQATSAQTALSGDLDVLKRTIANDIRPKQAQAEAEIAKQVEALNKTRNELAGVKSAQATYEETTTRRLSELTNLANGKASKSELTQTADELASKIASVKVGGRNYYRDSEKIRTSTRFFSFPLHPYLTQENVGETWTLSFDLKINEGGEIRPLHFYHYQTNRFGLKASADITPSKDWQRFTFTGPVIFPNDDPRYSRGEMALYDSGGNNNYSVRRIKLEKGTLATDWSPALEDIEGQLSTVESNFRQRADSLDAGVRSLTEGLRTKADISALNVTAENIRQSVKSLETNIQNKLDQKLSQVEFEVRAGSIHQEILNATKDKADKTLVVAEAGKLREEFSNLRVGGRNYYRDSEKIRTSTRFFSFPLHPYLTQENVGETWTLSFDLKINEGGEIRPLHFYHYQTNRFGLKASADITPSKDWQRFTFTGPVIFPNDDPRYSRGEMALYDSGGNNNYSVRRIKLEKGTLATDWSPALEDTEGLITEAKATFERTAQGLRTDLSAIQEYVNKDGQRQEALQRYTREESARQATAVRELVTRDYVGKATYQEDVKGINQRIEAVKTSANKEIASQIASYRQSVDGKFTDISSQITTYKQDVGGQISGLSNRLTSSEQGTTTQISNLSNRINSNKQGTDNQISNLKTQVATNKDNAERQMGRISDQVSANKANADSQFANVTNQLARKVETTDFQRVKETSQLYERILGNTENGIVNNVARMTLTSQMFQVEVGKAFANHQNLFLSSTATKGFLGNAGVINVANNTQKEIISDFISVEPNSKIIFQHWVTLPENGMAWTAWQFFDKNKNSIDIRRTGLNAYKTTTGKQHNINQIIVPANAYFIRVSARMYNDGLIKIEHGSVPSDYSVAPNDALEAVKTVQSQLAGSWAVQNINSAGDLISGINLGANGHNRFDGKLTHITGETLIDKAVIKDGMIANVSANKLTAGTIDARTVNLVNLNANNVTSGIFRGLTFEGGIIRGNNGNTVINLNDNVTTYNGYAKIEFKSPRNSLEFNSGGRKAFLAPTVSQDTNYAAFAFGVNDRGDHDPNRNFVGLKIFNQPDSRQVEIVGDLTITRYEEQGIRTTSLRSLFKLIDDNFKMLKDFRVRYGEGSPGFYDIRL